MSKRLLAPIGTRVSLDHSGSSKICRKPFLDSISIRTQFDKAFCSCLAVTLTCDENPLVVNHIHHIRGEKLLRRSKVLLPHTRPNLLSNLYIYKVGRNVFVSKSKINHFIRRKSGCAQCSEKCSSTTGEDNQLVKKHVKTFSNAIEKRKRKIQKSIVHFNDVEIVDVLLLFFPLDWLMCHESCRHLGDSRS